LALLRFYWRIPGCGSLKQKRHVLKSLTGTLRSTFNVSVAEVDHQDLWQRSTIAVAATGAEVFHVRKVMQQVERFVEAWGGVEVIEAELTLHHPDA
jgi:hypothetical protein